MQGSACLVPGKGMECNRSKSDPYGIGIQCARDPLECSKLSCHTSLIMPRVPDLPDLQTSKKRLNFRSKVIELLKNGMYSGDLGPSTIAGA